MSFPWFRKRFVKYLQRVESFMGICWEKTEKCLFKDQPFVSGSVILDTFFFSVFTPVESVFPCLIKV